MKTNGNINKIVPQRKSTNNIIMDTKAAAAQRLHFIAFSVTLRYAIKDIKFCNNISTFDMYCDVDLYNSY